MTTNRTLDYATAYEIVETTLRAMDGPYESSAVREIALAAVETARANGDYLPHGKRAIFDAVARGIRQYKREVDGEGRGPSGQFHLSG